MIKAFLAHSSKDKEGYVSKVAKELGPSLCVIDHLDFEVGMKIWEEIEKSLDDSNLYVFFLSEAALESKWVRAEMSKGKSLSEAKKQSRIYPIIIDKKITPTDKRIPDWMRDVYVLNYVPKPTKAARLIKQRLIELSFDIHPDIKERKAIFIGRNEIIAEFETRVGDLYKHKPVCLMASGLPKIGRSSFLEHCLKKLNIVRFSYIPPKLILESQDSIEDFILKLYDFGFSEDMSLKGLIQLSFDEKIAIATHLVGDIAASNEIIFIEDNGAIVNHDHNLSEWFLRLIGNVKSHDKIILAVTTRRRIHAKHKLGDQIFVIHVPELSPKEREGLFGQYLDFYRLKIDTANMRICSGIFSGYPEQILYTVDSIREDGIQEVVKRSHEISEFGSEKAALIIRDYANDDTTLDFMRLLSEFEAVAIDLIAEVVGGDSKRLGLLKNLLLESICEKVGVNGEYIRINDAIKDYILRIKLSLTEEYKKALRAHVLNFVKTYDGQNKDVADVFFSYRQAILDNLRVDDTFVLPSHYLKAMQGLYSERRYDEAIVIADRLLMVGDKYASELIEQVRYLLCLSLARKRSERFMQEIQKINGIEHDFLFGFYYRLKGVPSKAIERLLKVIQVRHNHSRAKRELVQAYINASDYVSGRELAKSNYELDKWNPYHIQAYLRCLLPSIDVLNVREKIENLLEQLGQIKSETAFEMYHRCQALYIAHQENDLEKSLSHIALLESGRVSPYVMIDKFHVCRKFNDARKMRAILDEFKEKYVKESGYFEVTQSKMEAEYFASIGEIEKATSVIYGNTSLSSDIKQKISESLTSRQAII